MPISIPRSGTHLGGVCLFSIALVLGGLSCNRAKSEPNQNPSSSDQDTLEQQAQLLIKTTSTPHVEGGVYDELPSWANELPFEIESKLKIPAAQNREQPYLEALLQFDFSLHLYFPHLKNADPKLLEHLDDASRKRAIEFGDFYIELLNEQDGKLILNADKITKAKRLLAPYEAGLKQLEEAQSRPEYYFHSSWETNSLSFHIFAADDATDLLIVKSLTALEEPQTIRSIKTVLQLKRDFYQLGSNVEQLICNRMEGKMLDYVVLPVLAEGNLAAEQLDRLIPVLLEHHQKSEQSDVFLEANQRQLLDFRHLFHLLTHQKFATPERVKDLGLQPDASIVELLLREIVDYGFYDINSESAKIEIEKSAQGNPQITSMWEKIKEDDDYLDAGARMMLGMFLHSELTSLRPGDLDNDIAVLNTRHQQVAEACKLGYPESTHRLKELESEWTLDQSWKTTRLLRWFKPQNRMASVRRHAQLRRNAMLCLSAIRKWQFVHDGELPTELGPALAAIDADSAIEDPYSGKPLQLSVNKDDVAVYSLGPDEDDDQAKIEFDPNLTRIINREKPPDGDVIFRIPIAIREGADGSSK